MLDEILEKGLGHLPGCWSDNHSYIPELEFGGKPTGVCMICHLTENSYPHKNEPECTCGADKRRKYLERFSRQPYPVEMTNAGIAVLERNGVEGNAAELSSLADLCFEAMIAKAEEGL